MASITITSEKARLSWRETIDAAYAEKQDVVIERYDRPVVTLVNYAKWQQTLQRLSELELIVEAKQALAGAEADPTSVVTLDELKRKLQMKKVANVVGD